MKLPEDMGETAQEKSGDQPEDSLGMIEFYHPYKIKSCHADQGDKEESRADCRKVPVKIVTAFHLSASSP
jgi:hypothetical protein